MEDKDEITTPNENGFSQEPPKFYFPSDLSGAPKEAKASTPTPEREKHQSFPTNLFGNSAILNIPELRTDPEPEPEEEEPAVDSIYDGPPRSKKIALILVPVVSLVLVLAIALTSILIIARLNKPDRSEYLFDMMGFLAVQNASSPSLWGYVNKDGEAVIDYQFLKAKPFTENGLAAVKLNYKGKWGYIDRNGDLVIDAVFEEANPFDSKGIAVVKSANNRYGMINENGDYVVEPEFDSLYPFNEFGVAYAIKYNNGTESGLIKRDGFEFIDLKAKSISAFSTDGYAAIGNGRLIDKNGKIIEIVKKAEIPGSVEIQATSVQKPLIDQEYFANDLVWVYMDGKYGYVNNKFEIVIGCNFKKANDFSNNGLAGVQFEDGTYGYINKKGETVISLAEYDGISKIGRFDDNGWAAVTFGGNNDLGILYGDLYLSNSSSVVVTAAKINMLNENGKFLFEEPTESFGYYEIGDNIVIRRLVSKDLFTYTAYNKNAEAAWKIESDINTIRRINDDRFIIKDSIYNDNGELVADLEEYGKDYDIFHHTGTTLDYIIYIAYGEDNSSENYYFIFDQNGKIVLEGSTLSYATPAFFSDGYVAVNTDENYQQMRQICTVENGNLTQIFKVRGYVDYNSVTSYFESGRSGNSFFIDGLFR